MTEPTLSTREAADRLGVKPETVYAYVSRGLLTRSPGPRRDGSRFSAAEVDRLATSRRGSPSEGGVAETVASGLTLLDGGRLWFRGRDAAALAAGTDLAGVATLLWATGEPVRFSPVPEAVDAARRVAGALPDTARLADRLRVAVWALAAADPWRFDLTPAAVTRAGAGLVGSLLAVLAPEVEEEAEAEGSPGARLWPALTEHAEPPAGGVADLDAALVLLADHGLAASTLTARVAASARAHPYAVVSAGLGALDGPYHGTASTAAHRLLADALASGPGTAIAERVRAGEHLPGFGHTVYTERDPRADVLLDRLAATEAGAAARELAAEVSARRGMFANVDLGLAALVHAHGMRADAAETVFAVARTVGWIAHALEEYGEPGLRFRVRGRYTGSDPS